jgi:hypothetical protein
METLLLKSGGWGGCCGVAGISKDKIRNYGFTPGGMPAWR